MKTIMPQRCTVYEVNCSCKQWWSKWGIYKRSSQRYL